VYLVSGFREPAVKLRAVRDSSLMRVQGLVEEILTAIANFVAETFVHERRTLVAETGLADNTGAVAALGATTSDTAAALLRCVALRPANNVAGVGEADKNWRDSNDSRGRGTRQPATVAANLDLPFARRDSRTWLFSAGLTPISARNKSTIPRPNEENMATPFRNNQANATTWGDAIAASR
jgi:hypothetical protein